MRQGLALAWLMGIAFMGQSWALFPRLSLAFALVIMFIVAVQIYAQTLLQYPILKLLNGLVAAVLVVVLGYSYAQQQLQQRLDLRQSHIAAADVIIYVDRLNQPNPRSVTQQVTVLNARAQPMQWLTSTPLNERTQQPKTEILQLGEYYRVTGQVRPALGYATTGAFDQEKWYVQQNIMAFLRIEQVEKLSSADIAALAYRPSFWVKLRVAVDQQRLAVRDYLQQQSLQQHGLLLGLLTGDRSGLDDQTEADFQRFGLSHLLAISGPHVLIFAAMVCFVLQLVLTRYRANMYLKWPKQYLLIVPFLLCVVIYTACVGFEIPALRTLLICSLTCAFMLLRQSLQPFTLLLYSAAVLLLFDPFSVLSAAFWLSYGACFILLRIYQTIQAQDQRVVSRRQQLIHSIKLFVESQWKIFIALLPLMLIFFKQVAWISPLSNLIAIPYLGLVVVPLDILAGLAWLLFEPLGLLLWQINDQLLQLLLGCLHLLDHLLNPSLVPWAMNTWQLAALILALLLLFLPRGIVPKTWSILAVLPLFFYDSTRQGFELHVLDVGQGQAILIRDQGQSLMVDVGGSMDEGRFSIGENVIFPFLMHQGIQDLDQLVLSHLDQDHSGAYPVLSQKIAIKQLISNEQPKHPPLAVDYCYAGKSWQWQRVKFEVLSPHKAMLAAAEKARNETSCVLYVTYLGEPNKHFLLMGDAGWPTEHQLLLNHPHLKVDVLVLGHHGSKNSSAYDFLAHYKPKLVLASAGFANRYGHPSQELYARVEALNLPLLTTIDQGSVQFKIDQQHQLWLHAQRHERLWLQREGLQSAIKPQLLEHYINHSKQGWP